MEVARALVEMMGLRLASDGYLVTSGEIVHGNGGLAVGRDSVVGDGGYHARHHVQTRMIRARRIRPIERDDRGFSCVSGCS
jgi:hypothetical protein